MDPLIARLMELQGSRSDTEMARLLGTSRAQWNHLKGSRRKPTLRFGRRAVQVFGDECPELATDLAGQEHEQPAKETAP
jgi:hypothetical protein